MSAPYQFSVTKPKMIQLGLCVVVIQLFLYGAGVATGVIVGPQAQRLAEQVRPIRVPVVKKSDEPAMSANAAPVTQNEKSSVTRNEPALAPLKQETPAPQGQQALAPTAPAATEASQFASRLAVQAGSFHSRENAMRLAEVLKRQGFGPVTVGQYDSRNETWHFVRLGPFKQWEDASRVAAQLDRSYDLRAYVLPGGAGDN